MRTKIKIPKKKTMIIVGPHIWYMSSVRGAKKRVSISSSRKLGSDRSLYESSSPSPLAFMSMPVANSEGGPRVKRPGRKSSPSSSGEIGESSGLCLRRPIPPPGPDAGALKPGACLAPSPPTGGPPVAGALVSGGPPPAPRPRNIKSAFAAVSLDGGVFSSKESVLNVLRNIVLLLLIAKNLLEI